MNELYLASNIEDVLVAQMEDYYSGTLTDVVVVSAKDYVIGLYYDDGKKTYDVSEEDLDGLDYQLQSSWYKAVRETGKIFFTKPHFNNGDYYLHCGAPYYDSDGNFCGRVGIGTRVDYLYDEIVDSDPGDPAKGIIVNQDGKIIMSSEDEGLFVVGDKDMRFSKNENLSQAFRRMVAMENDIMGFTLNDTKYYIAFAPIKIVNWSFGTIIENKTAMPPPQQLKKKCWSR